VTLATVGVVLSAGLIGLGSYGLFNQLGLAVPLTWCLVFGALISPTDPVAVLGIMRSAGAPRSLEVKVVGESLLNDGVGVVLFTILLAVARGSTAHGEEPGAGHFLQTAFVEVAGGLLLGLVAGYLAYRAMRSLDEPNLEILISVALVMGVSLLSFRLHASAPLACVVAGLFIGNHGRRFAMSDRTRTALDLVWEFLDEGLNAVLFLLVGLEVVVAVRYEAPSLAAGVLMIPLALGARAVSVALPIEALRRVESFTPGVVRVLTWGGLKGGISVALALSLPAFPGRAVVLTVTYVVVLFSIIVQGLTVGRVVRLVATGAADSDS
jgi:CPA1 family monovalent cation:H+ antiporter